MGVLKQSHGGKVRVGAKAPQFTLPGHDGRDVSLSEFRGEKTVVLYFYPQDETPGCVRESCSFRDYYDEFTEAGAEVIGVSSDSLESHAEFAVHHFLPFTLLSDSDGSVRERYGAKGPLYPGRVTFVIDSDGIVVHIFSSQTKAKRHVSEALKVVHELEPAA